MFIIKNMCIKQLCNNKVQDFAINGFPGAKVFQGL